MHPNGLIMGENARGIMSEFFDCAGNVKGRYALLRGFKAYLPLDSFVS